MDSARAERVATCLVEKYGDSVAEQIVSDDSSAASAGPFPLLCVCVLARRRAVGWTAMAAYRALDEEGWSSPDRLAASPWRGRVRALERAGYETSAERTSFIVGHLAEEVRDRYHGDLSNLRDEAGQRPSAERSLLKELKGVEDDTVGMFFREVQGEWRELCPFADERVLRAARRLDLPAEIQSLVELVGRDAFPRLATGLAHVDRADAYDAIVQDTPRTADLHDPSDRLNVDRA